MNKFSIKNQKEKVECLMWISDLYKDVYGFRPRGYNFEAWSFQELTDFVNDLFKQSEEEEEYERQVEEKAIEDVMSLGCDKKTALRWLDDADAHYVWNDDEFYQDSIEKYGWVSKYYDNLISKK
tara:strand:- start:767 stop:1138 length:372 start_codon:yes stop_codon:yes gene_type:complete